MEGCDLPGSTKKVTQNSALTNDAAEYVHNGGPKRPCSGWWVPGPTALPVRCGHLSPNSLLPFRSHNTDQYRLERSPVFSLAMPWGWASTTRVLKLLISESAEHSLRHCHDTGALSL